MIAGRHRPRRSLHESPRYRQQHCSRQRNPWTEQQRFYAKSSAQRDPSLLAKCSLSGTFLAWGHRVREGRSAACLCAGMCRFTFGTGATLVAPHPSSACALHAKRARQARTMTFAKLATIGLSKAWSNIHRLTPARRGPVAIYFAVLKDPSMTKFCRGSPCRGRWRLHPPSPTVSWFDRSSAADGNRSSGPMVLLLRTTVEIP